MKIEISDNATNGDMIKAMFPNIVIEPFYTNEPILIIDVGINEDCAIRCTQDWWNSPYKADKEGE